MARNFAMLPASLILLSGLVHAQGLNTTATKDDWEEINFEFNSAILSDGYPSLLRLAELLSKNPDYKVRLVGNTDWVGSHPYNDKLGNRRSEAVRQFLQKYGAQANQISIETRGERSPKVDNKSREGRFMNRRVEMVVTDGSGKVIGAGGISDTLKALQELAKKQEECCSQILRRLDKLDEILNALRDLKAQNDNLRADVDKLKGEASKPLPPPPPPGPTASEIEKIANSAADRAVAGLKTPKFSILGLNAGPDSTGNITFSGRGRFFNAFNRNIAVQAQGEYMYFRDRKEGQFDVGLVNRWWNVQMGGFASFKTVGFREFQSNGTLGQFAATFDYLFGQGKIGVFGTKSFLDNAVVNRTNISRNVIEETFLRVTDQIGAQGAVSLGKRAWLEGNLGYVHTRFAGDKPGGTIRLVFPVNRMFALTAEGGFNETLITRDHNGRAVFGFLFGNYMTPREYKAANHPVPVEVPRVRYEMLTRRVRTGNDPPVADAGPDQNGIPAGQVTLDGSASYDPDGDPITFQWTQVAGAAVTLSAPTAAKTTFTAAEGQTYAFRLTVKDDKGAQAVARTNVSTREPLRVRIIRFTANPTLVRSGDAATLNYLVENAETVTISGVSQTLSPTTGSAQVTPTQTTSYTLVARNRTSEDSAVVTVLVDRPLPRILVFKGNPPTIDAGQSSTLQWQTQDADTVEIQGLGTFPVNGQTPVTPATTTAYTLIARNRNGEASASAVINVNTGNNNNQQRPVVVNFSANPVTIVEGDSSTLTWQVTGADEVVIQPFGTVPASGTRQVSPTATTTYTLTATNHAGSTVANATVEVLRRAKFTTCMVTPTVINSAGQPVTFSWQADNAQYVFIDNGIGQRPATGSLTNAGPIRTTTYTLTAVGRGSQDTCSVTVTLQPTSGGGSNQGPTAIIAGGGEIVTSFRELILNGSPSFDPNDKNLTYSWRSVDGRATVVNPTSPTPNVQLVQTNYGDFNFELTVTNSKGLISKANTRVILVQARPVF